jgi:hypothetical protein
MEDPKEFDEQTGSNFLDIGESAQEKILDEVENDDEESDSDSDSESTEE